ncbi:uncharacterized protein LOC116299195 [Actinia tenebrosa]|uniref:Uncharacterized protein LOC116299195 n=1 Tax=Actinia tenebrosa TaxID=6105 RepID=A0A6P8I6T8_ACTTE|nr:uncharacterized protein LOC116299195 [Actinia tenebrosa]
MAASYTVLSKFQIFITQIGLELTSLDIKILKSLIRDLLPPRVLEDIDIKEQLPGLDLFARLQEYCWVSQNNLGLLKQVLEIAGRVDLVKRIESFEKTVTELIDAPQSLMEVLPAPNTVFLRLLLCDPKRSEELTQKTNSLREAICKKLELELKDVAFITKEDASHQDCVFILFQFPNLEPKIMELNCDALNRADWLVSLGVLQLQIGGKASINIKENLQDIRPIPKRQTSVLAVNSSFAVHKDNVLDVILGIELSFLVNEGVSSQLLSQCQSALNIISQLQSSFDDGGPDMKAGVVTYGNHSNTQQPIAFVTKGLSKDFDIMKNERQYLGGKECSGMGDAVKKVVELTDDVRKEASKVCIMFTFLNPKSYDPKYYRCSHDNDIIKQCYALARSGITLYIIGINTAQLSSKGENHFLPGVAALGGGFYLEVDDLGSLDKIITCIIKHDVSIENRGKVACKALIDEINRKYGIVNINHLARYLKQNLNQKAIGIDGIRQNGEILVAPISQISQRVAVANDLEDAIDTVQAMTVRLKANAIHERSQANLRLCGSRKRPAIPSEALASLDSIETAERDLFKKKSDISVENLCEKYGGNDVCLVENEPIDLEVASRMVRRHVHRLEYQKINEEEDME